MPRFASFFVVLALLAPACGKEIGDPCTTNVDCAQDGTRDCDLSQPGGYCTVNGCDEKFCPSEAVCIRVFPYAPGKKCTADSDCTSDGLCLPDVPDSYCVPRAAERRYCERSCGSNGDCRGGYVCREAAVEGNTPVSNTYGSIALVANANTSTVVRFCAPAP
ncbi:MAG TPA: hypothetical protein VF524_06780 [Polyangia bacterium]